MFQFIVSKLKFLYIICFSISLLSCSINNVRAKTENKEINVDTVSYLNLGVVRRDSLIINRDIDLNGGFCLLPNNKTLVFKGGIIKNGTLVGKKTRIESKGVAFNHVTIDGSWNVPKISTSLFADLTYENAIKDVLSLTNPEVNNDVIIEEGEYIVSAKRSGDRCLNIVSKTTLTINGTIQLLPNKHRSYSILNVEGDNILIKGNGLILGDRDNHLGNSGEWGMGINVLSSNHVEIRGITVKKCWGDCIYIGSDSQDVLVDGCFLDGSRRQGVSITSGADIHICNCDIQNIGGTEPEYAIDVEPNSNEKVYDVFIEGVRIKNCRGGITTNGRAPNALLEKVIIKDCRISEIQFRAPLWFKSTDYVEINNCDINIDVIKFVFRFTNVKNAVIRGNKVYAKRYFMEPCSNVEISNNIIECGGFYTNDDKLNQLKNVTIKGNVFQGKIPSLPSQSIFKRVRIFENKKNIR